jgi:hypothetical protein
MPLRFLCNEGILEDDEDERIYNQKSNYGDYQNGSHYFEKRFYCRFELNV